MSSLAYATIWANKRSCCSAKPGDGSTTPSNNNNNNINNRLYLEGGEKHLNSSPKTLMTLWPSKQLQNIDATTNNYKIYHIKKIKI